jgi:hypothetical protein
MLEITRGLDILSRAKRSEDIGTGVGLMHAYA